MLTVGVCEDDPAIRRVLQRSLRYAEHSSVFAHNGAEALRLFPEASAEVRPVQGTTLAVIGLHEATIGDTAFAANIPVHRLYTETPDLEDAFLTLTHGEAAIR
jgi:CheY-like chemotaxis protein